MRIGEIVDASLVRFAEYDTSVEEATEVCVESWVELVIAGC